jgi:hypothetical protein
MAAMYRIVMVLPALAVAAVLAWVWLTTNVFRPAPAEERLAGVRVSVIGYTIEDLPDDRHRLNVTVRVTSPRDVEECLGFALDQPFAGRRLEPLAGMCPRPRAGESSVTLTFDKATDDDLLFPEHTVVWGIPGGRCGPILELFGVCVIEQVGTADLVLPSRNPLPTFGPIGSLFPLLSFDPP